MKAGIALMLGLLLAFVLVFAYWIRTAHRFETQWTPWTAGPNRCQRRGRSKQVPMISSLPSFLVRLHAYRRAPSDSNRGTRHDGR